MNNPRRHLVHPVAGATGVFNHSGHPGLLSSITYIPEGPLRIGLTRLPEYPFRPGFDTSRRRTLENSTPLSLREYPSCLRPPGRYNQARRDITLPGHCPRESKLRKSSAPSDRLTRWDSHRLEIADVHGVLHYSSGHSRKRILRPHTDVDVRGARNVNSPPANRRG